VLRLQKARFDGGVAPESDMRQAESQYQIAAAEVPLLQRQVAQQENLISLLAGRNPRVAVTNPVGCNVKWKGQERHWMPPEACDLV